MPETDVAGVVEPAPKPSERVPPERLPAAVEALLLSSDRAVSPEALARAIRPEGENEPSPAAVAEVRSAVDALNAAYAQSGRSFRIEPVAGGLRIMTTPEFASIVGAFQRRRQGGRLSPAAVETLAVIAYRQPIARARIEAIRGVACGEVLRSLMDRRLVTIKGRAEELGRPMLYGTTRQFLEFFGLASLKDLPGADEPASTP